MTHWSHFHVHCSVIYNNAKIWKQPKCPLVDESIKKLWYIHMMPYYLAIKKKEIPPL